MTVDQLKGQLRPFRPFSLHLDDGTILDLPHPDFITFLSEKAGNNFVLVDRSGGIHLVDAGHVNRIEFVKNGSVVK